MNKQLTLRLQNVIFYVLFIMIIGLLAWLGKTYQKDFDLTHAQENSLNGNTQLLLKKLDKPLKLTAFIPDDAVIHSALKKLVNKYKKYKTDVTLEFVNPELDPQRAKLEGIEYSGLVKLNFDDRSEIINSVDEQTMVDVLQRLSREKPRLAIFTEGHGERSPLASTSNGFSQVNSVLQKKGFTLQPHNILRTQSIPTDTSLLVIASPTKNFIEGEVEIITDYIKQGGNLLWLHEPGSIYGLDDVEQLLGLELQEGTIVDANIDLQNMLGIKHPAVIAVIDYGTSELTRDLPAHTLFPFPTAVIKDESLKKVDTTWSYQPLLISLGTSWLESGEMQGNVKFDDDDDKPGPLSIAMTLKREQVDSQSQESKPQEQRIIVIGDSDFMTNSFIGQGSNLELSTNIFNWLGNDEQLISIGNATALDVKLTLTPWVLYSIALFLLIGLPILLLLIGILRWLNRRKR